MFHKSLVIGMLSTMAFVGMSLDAATFPSQNQKNYGENPTQRKFTNNPLRTPRQQQVRNSPDQDYQASNADKSLESKVRQSLSKGHKDYNDTLSVKARNGKVIIQGQVDTLTDLELIEERLNDLPEITLLENQIEIRPEKSPNTRWHQRDFDQVESKKKKY